MLRAFFDDSGMDENSSVFVMAGFLAKVEVWEDFTEQWQAALDVPAPQALSRLKAVEAFGLRGDFAGFSATERDERLKQFVLITKRQPLHCFVTVFPKDAYHRAFKGRFVSEFLDRPYFVALFMTMVRARKLAAQLGIDGHLDFIFDSQQDSHRAISREWKIFNSLAPEDTSFILSSPPSFEKDEEFAPLQAADLLAWLVRREYFEIDRGRDPTKQPHHIFLANMLNLERDHFEVVTEAELWRMADEIGSDHRNQRYAAS